MSVAAARPASTVVLLRPADPFEVFLVRRSDSIAFMGGAHVFPGGRVDDEDRLEDIDALSDGAAAAAARMSDLPPEIAVAHHVAALRELFEEAGVMLAREMPAQPLEGYRRDLLAGEITFGDIVRAERLRLAFDDLAYFAHWVTPEIETRRFDTRFFIARAPEGQTPVHDEGETSHSEWLEPASAIQQCRDGAIPRLQPRFEKRGEQTLLFYPGDPMYPAVEGFDATETRFVLENKRWRPIS